MNTTSTADAERRQHHQVRAVFVRSCEMLAPYVADNEHVKTVSNFAMGHMLIEQFPELSSADVNIIIMTVEKLHRERRLRSILNQT